MSTGRNPQHKRPNGRVNRQGRPACGLQAGQRCDQNEMRGFMPWNSPRPQYDEVRVV